MAGSPPTAIPVLLSLAIAPWAAAQFPPPERLRAVRGEGPPSGVIFPIERMPTLPTDGELRRRTVPEAVRQAAIALDATSWKDRDEASRELLASRVALEDLYAVLSDPALSPESRQRLVGITVERIVNSPRGALGVRMDIGRDDGAGVRITATIPGMPAERHLEPDDLIVAIDGGAVNDRSDLIRVVQGKAPTDPVRIEALRPVRDDRGKVRIDANGNPVTRRIDVTFPLGSTRDLERSGDPGNTLFSDPVSAERAELARMVRERWSPRPARVRLPSDREAATRLSEGDVELHPEIQALRRYREAVDAGLIVYEPSAAAALEAQQREFEAMSADPAFSEEERAWYAKVARRYLELIPPRE